MKKIGSTHFYVIDDMKNGGFGGFLKKNRY